MSTVFTGTTLHLHSTDISLLACETDLNNELMDTVHISDTFFFFFYSSSILFLRFELKLIDVTHNILSYYVKKMNFIMKSL